MVLKRLYYKKIYESHHLIFNSGYYETWFEDTAYECEMYERIKTDFYLIDFKEKILKLLLQSIRFHYIRYFEKTRYYLDLYDRNTMYRTISMENIENNYVLINKKNYTFYKVDNKKYYWYNKYHGNIISPSIHKLSSQLNKVLYDLFSNDKSLDEETIEEILTYKLFFRTSDLSISHEL